MSDAIAARCHIADTTLLAYRDAELEAVEADRLTAHIAACPACQARLGAGAGITAALQAGTPLRGAPARRAAVHAAVAGQRGGWWLGPALRGATLAMALMLMLVTGLRWWDDRACPDCAAGPGPANVAITQLAGLPARLASPLLRCAAPNGASAWEAQQAARLAPPQSASAAGNVPLYRPIAAPAPRPATAAKMAQPVTHRPVTAGPPAPAAPTGPRAAHAPTAACAPTAPGMAASQYLAQPGSTRPGS